jgi:hypothetical protein
MKRKSPHEDAVARAKQYRKPHLARVNLDEIGFREMNRGGLGVCSNHLQFLASHIKDEMTQRQRYECVDLIKIPKESLQKVLQVNRDRCEADPLMPRFSSKIMYVCITKTHFVHAHKLAKDGTHTLYNRGEDPIRWQDADTEGAQIIEHGPLCAMYSRRMFKDIEAADAVANQDNIAKLFLSASPSMRGWVHSPSQSTSECDSE